MPSSREAHFKQLLHKIDMAEKFLTYPVCKQNGDKILEYSKPVTLLSVMLRSKTIVSWILPEVLCLMEQLVVGQEQTSEKCAHNNTELFFMILDHFQWVKTVAFASATEREEFLSDVCQFGELLNGEAEERFSANMVLLCGPAPPRAAVKLVLRAAHRWPQRLLPLITEGGWDTYSAASQGVAIKPKKEHDEVQVTSEDEEADTAKSVKKLALDLILTVQPQGLPPIIECLCKADWIEEARPRLSQAAFSRSDGNDIVLKTIRERFQCDHGLIDAYFRAMRARGDSALLPLDVWLAMINGVVPASTVTSATRSQWRAAAIKMVRSAPAACGRHFAQFISLYRTSPFQAEGVMLAMTCGMPEENVAELIRYLCNVLSTETNSAILVSTLGTLVKIGVLRGDVFCRCGASLAMACECVDSLSPEKSAQYCDAMTHAVFFTDEDENLYVNPVAYDSYLKLLAKQLHNPQRKYKAIGAIGASLLMAQLVTRSTYFLFTSVCIC